MGNTERVILIKGDSTKWYNQAIFIVNKETPATKMPVDFVAEAEKIIYNHVVGEKNLTYKAEIASKYAAAPRPKKKPKASAFDVTLNLMMFMACIAIVAVLAFGIMS
ncbi:MAG: hypothetical protein FWG87_01825 [Defluviitaleaceae bacterium]|nr:hypothetical protein [Defluviitaleaceae bacterium]